jgi:hypothetical protein
MAAGLALTLALLAGASGTGCTPSPPSALVSVWPPGLFPAFDRTVTDYVLHCGDPTSVVVNAPSGTTVSVDGRPARSGSFTTPVARSVGQSFRLVVNEPSRTPSGYYLRCLPDDFPRWSAARTGTPQAEYYITVPGAAFGAGTRPIIFDNHGVPVWWGRDAYAFSASLLPNGHLLWTPTPGGGRPAEERSLDGTLIRTIAPTVGELDSHDILRLPNGDDVVVTVVPRTGVDLNWLCAGTICGPTNTTIEDPIIQELAPDGTLVWSWDVADHIPVTEFRQEFAAQELLLHRPIDVYHWNSIEYTGSGFIVSFRHLNAIYDIDRASGKIVWKLGGSPRPESLVVKNDPATASGGFHGQHDARLSIDGSLTVHDNGTGHRPPRAVRYRLDTTTSPGTATLVEQLTDPFVSASICCGSARRLPGGDWVMGWGGNSVVTEAGPDGSRVFTLQFLPWALNYRAVPVLPGVLDRAELRAAMDAQYRS